MEYYDVVNEKDEVIGKASRKECHSNPALIHRGANIYIFNSPALEFILRMKRSIQQDTEKGKFIFCLGEHVRMGEDYESAIKRGIYEEIGLESLPLRKIGDKIIHRLKIQTEIHQNFIGIYTGDLNKIKLNREEVVKAEFISISELIQNIQKNRNAYASYTESALSIIMPYLKK
jgi:isopentenyldiphosphate isomerase